MLATIAFPNFDPVAFHLGPLAVRWYGLAYLAGFLAAWWILRIFDEKWQIGLGPEGRTSTVLAAVIGVIVGGRLGYVLFYNLPSYLHDPIKIIQIWDGGMSFHGGLIGILLAGVWVAHHYKVPYLTLCDVGAIGAPIGFFLGRLANFVNGELWGRPTSVPWAVIFPAAPLVNGVNVPRHPSQIYEALLEGLVLFIVMLWLARKPHPRGLLVGWMLTLYGAFRIFVEFFRQPDVQIGFLPGGITEGQLLSIPVLVAGIALIWWALRKGRSEGGQPRVQSQSEPAADAAGSADDAGAPPDGGSGAAPGHDVADDPGDDTVRESESDEGGGEAR